MRSKFELQISGDDSVESRFLRIALCSVKQLLNYVMREAATELRH